MTGVQTCALPIWCYNPTLRCYFISFDVTFLEFVPYYLDSESGTSPTPAPVLSILRYPDILISSSSTLENGGLPTPHAPAITQVYTRRG